MYSPFFTNHRRYQQPHPTYHPFHPVYHVDPATEDLRPAKVVRIPVQYAGSERLDRAESAVKIQKVFSGFLARKSLRKVKDIEIEVDEIEERLKSAEAVELLKTDAKERLRMSESLMSLLLKLDSIRGVDFGVRAFRKAVIRKAIALQERIDAIVAGGE
ncbi:BAG family molecular chaperone regulator 5, mitochondrial-like [Salvia divinorum]|uniref:BAG family molecular chaperone regulator 5, mitochondrial-like n=1 Tax=Salvia divinorum TaxID=28513 RepID=A0ABD1IAG0_SALDI